MADACRSIKVGLVGFGVSGRVFHAPFITTHPGLQLAGVVERHAQHARSRYPWLSIARSLSDLLRDETIELVVITTPNASHHALAQEALLAGRHVVVEKPFTVTSQEADDLIQLARDRGRILAVYHNRRWDGDFQTVRQLIASGLLGRVVDYEAHFDRYRPTLKANSWREEEVPGSGIVYDLGSHLIDQALCLFGMPQGVCADLRVEREAGKSVDSFTIVLNYDRLRATLKAGMLVREPGPRFVMHGTLGSFVKHGLDPQESALRQGATPGAAGWGTESPELWGTLDTEIGGLHFRGRIETRCGAYQHFYDNVYQAIVAGQELAVKPEQARSTIRLIELVEQASRAQRTLPFAP